MKKSAFVRFYHRDAHYYVIISYNICPYDWPFRTGYWNAYVTCLMGMASKNLFTKSDFSQMHLSRSRFDYELWMNLSRSDSSDWWSDCWLWTQPWSNQLTLLKTLNETFHNDYKLHTDVTTCSECYTLKISVNHFVCVTVLIYVKKM